MRMCDGSGARADAQFSLIDSRPIFGMAKVCQTYGLKLLTYGSFVSPAAACDTSTTLINSVEDFYPIAG
jgi:hypothetical protein